MANANMDLCELVKKLKYEKLFIGNEKKEIENLNKKVQHLCTSVLKESWLTGQSRLLLESLSRGHLESPFSTQFALMRDEDEINGEKGDLQLLEAQRLIPPKYYQSYIDLLSLLRAHPHLVGLCITTYEKEKDKLVPIIAEYGTPSGVSSDQVLEAIINIYGGVGGPLPDDGTLHLRLLSVLAGMQIVGSDMPRRVLRQGSCAFSSLYRLISETIPSARLFLVASLSTPVRVLLSSPQLLSLSCPHTPPTPLSLSVSLSTFGPLPPNADIAQLDRTTKMAELAKLFLESILDNIHAFPTGLAWLIKSIRSQLSESLSEKEVSTICTDLIWALYICPAVTNPEPFGVTNAPVGPEERHILSQVANILQSLALYPYEGNSQHISEYISFFDTSSLSSILDTVLSMERNGAAGEESNGISSLFRRTVLLPETQIESLFDWFKESLLLLERNGKLTEIELWPHLVRLSSSVSDSLPTLHLKSSLATALRKSGSSTSLTTSSSTSSPAHRPTTLLPNGKTPSSLLGRRDVKSSGSTPGSLTDLNSSGDSERGGGGGGGGSGGVRVVSFAISQEGWEWIGMLPESEVANGASRKSSKEGTNGGSTEGDGEGIEDPDDDEREDRSILGEKRTRFSVSQDDASYVTSDNLEAVSEGASTHSVSSSIELEDQNDNLSDMMSANVSGRGSPNVSGRNSPLDEEGGRDGGGGGRGGILGDEEDEAMGEEEEIERGQNGEAGNPPPNVNPPNINSLNLNGRNPSNRASSEIDDKFCKFEIKKSFGGDETVSLVSETWSTDVLASDSEMGGESRLLFPPEVISGSGGGGGGIGGGGGVSGVGSGGGGSGSNRVIIGSGVDVSGGGGETMSEAWSTDVAASDIERLHDFDAEESGSGVQSEDALLFDTPRSSVSGGPVYSQQQPIDLLLFGELGGGQENSVSNFPPDSIPMETEPPVPNNSPRLIPVPVSRSSSDLMPKTITFDKTAERGDKEQYDEEPGRTRKFFRNFKIFRGRSGRKGREDRFEWSGERMPENPSLLVPKLRKNSSEEGVAPTESSDDILAKYRRKPSLDSNFIPAVFKGATSCSSSLPSQSGGKESLKITRAELVIEARKKLRQVLGNCDLQLLDGRNSSLSGVSLDVALINILRVEVASAISRADNVSAAQLQESIRMIKQLGVEGSKKVVRQLRDDYRRRSEYVSYLIRAKQGLLSTLNFLERASERSSCETETYNNYLVSEWVRLKLEEPIHDTLLNAFVTNFRAIKTVDEKIELLDSFISSRLSHFKDSIPNKNLSSRQISKLENALEQQIVTRVYYYAMYPNGEADVHRDSVLKEHIAKLSGVISPSHKDLRIPKSHLSECPWPPAQRELKMLSAYKTGGDKLRCVVRTSALIVSLLSRSSDRVVAADDFVPVLVFVMIKSNPPALLSTIQYVNSFYGNKILGEDQYWWTQFCSAVEFIKTMDYNE